MKMPRKRYLSVAGKNDSLRTKTQNEGKVTEFEGEWAKADQGSSRDTGSLAVKRRGRYINGGDLGGQSKRGGGA